jgi:hypothetical protein
MILAGSLDALLGLMPTIIAQIIRAEWEMASR